MIKKYLVTSFLCFPFLPLASQAYWQNYIEDKAENSDYLVFAENTNVRDRPGLQGNVTFQLQPGDRVKVLERQNEITEINDTRDYWYRIDYRNRSGFVWGGLLADVSAIIGKRTILVRNLGVKKLAMEICVIEEGKPVARTRWETGPVGNSRRAQVAAPPPRKEGADYQFALFKTGGFSDPPLMIFALGYGVLSEVEMGWQEFNVFTLNRDQSLSSHFKWIPGSCDPPACGESTLLFPGDMVQADQRIKRQAFTGRENRVLLVKHNYDIDHPDQHSFQIREYIWNGGGFKEKPTGDSFQGVR